MLVVAPWLTVRPALKPGSEKWRSVLPRDQKVSFAAGGSFVQKTQRNRVRQAAHAPVSWAQGESFQPFPLHLRGRRVCERVCVYTPGTHAAPALPGCGPDGAARAPRFVGGGGWRRSRTGGRSSGGRAAARCLDRSTRSPCFRLDGGPPTFAVRRDDVPPRGSRPPSRFLPRASRPSVCPPAASRTPPTRPPSGCPVLGSAFLPSPLCFW